MMAKGFRLAAIAVVLGLGSAAAHAQNAPTGFPAPTIQRIDPVADPDTIPLYKEKLPENVTERWNRMFGDQIMVRNITQPTLTPVLPDPAKATGAAVIVIPGGGFKFVSMSNEGWPVARWLADHGIAAFVLKYRTNETPDDDMAMLQGFIKLVSRGPQADAAKTPDVSEPRATADALAALAMVRANAAKWHIDPARVGALGFSAGAMTALNAVRDANAAARPNFFGYIYGPMAAIDVSADAPPMFAALAMDDPLFGKQGYGIVEAWHAAKRPVELHVYEQGSHGYGGLGKAGTTTTLMMDEFYAWMKMRGILKAAPAGK
jgi:acetyl esterase/lipase